MTRRSNGLLVLVRRRQTATRIYGRRQTSSQAQRSNDTQSSQSPPSDLIPLSNWPLVNPSPLQRGNLLHFESVLSLVLSTEPYHAGVFQFSNQRPGRVILYLPRGNLSDLRLLAILLYDQCNLYDLRMHETFLCYALFMFPSHLLDLQPHANDRCEHLLHLRKRSWVHCPYAVVLLLLQPTSALRFNVVVIRGPELYAWTTWLEMCASSNADTCFTKRASARVSMCTNARIGCKSTGCAHVFFLIRILKRSRSTYQPLLLPIVQCVVLKYSTHKDTVYLNTWMNMLSLKFL